MNYILLDLEWNQAYFEQSQAVQKRLGTRLRGEVIQIGAVKLNEALELCGSFSVIVKPKFFRRIHRHVMELTGITQNMIDRGVTLEEATARFQRFIGEDCVFLTWGPDDVPMFADNLRAHEMPTEWMPPVYDLQVIYNMQTDGSSRQRSLEYAMEQFGIEQHLPAHDALNDAYFTALVAAKLDIAKGIAEYTKHQGQFLGIWELGNADVGETGYTAIDDILKDESLENPTCPLCGDFLEKTGKLLHAKGQRYSRLCTCAEHGKLMLSVRVIRNLNETLRARCTITEATEEKIATYETKLKNAEMVKTARRRHRKSNRKAPAAKAE